MDKTIAFGYFALGAALLWIWMHRNTRYIAVNNVNEEVNNKTVHFVPKDIQKQGIG